MKQKTSIPLVSIIVHTKNSKRTIVAHLESIRRQSYPHIEIIAVDNFSTDGTQLLLRKYTNSVYQHGPERSAQRNFGVAKAHGKFVLIPDSDMILSENVIKACVDLVDKNSVMKAIVIPERSIGLGFWAACKALERQCYENDPHIEAARFFERATFLHLHGYDENITGPEDWDLPQRLQKSGYLIGRIGEYILHDEGNLKLLSVVKKKYYYGLKLHIYLRKHALTSNLSQMIYLLRPAFYRNWKLLLSRPVTTLGMMIMLTSEQAAGFLGFINGRKGRYSS